MNLFTSFQKPASSWHQNTQDAQPAREDAYVSRGNRLHWPPRDASIRAQCGPGFPDQCISLDGRETAKAGGAWLRGRWQMSKPLRLHFVSAGADETTGGAQASYQSCRVTRVTDPGDGHACVPTLTSCGLHRKLGQRETFTGYGQMACVPTVSQCALDGLPPWRRKPVCSSSSPGFGTRST